MHDRREFSHVLSLLAKAPETHLSFRGTIIFPSAETRSMIMSRVGELFLTAERFYSQIII